jgi:hypothetical protein
MEGLQWARISILETRWRAGNDSGLCCPREYLVSGIFPRSVVALNGLVVPVSLPERAEDADLSVSVHFNQTHAYFPPIPICIPAPAEVVPCSSWSGCCRFSILAFESGSRLSRIERCAFQGCLLLKSICIPSSVEVLGEACFCNCDHLLTVTFDRWSRLSRIGPSAFLHCCMLSSIGIPSSVELLSERCFLVCDSFRSSHSRAVLVCSESRILRSRVVQDCNRFASHRLSKSLVRNVSRNARVFPL